MPNMTVLGLIYELQKQVTAGYAHNEVSIMMAGEYYLPAEVVMDEPCGVVTIIVRE